MTIEKNSGTLITVMSTSTTFTDLKRMHRQAPRNASVQFFISPEKAITPHLVLRAASWFMALSHVTLSLVPVVLHSFTLRISPKMDTSRSF